VDQYWWCGANRTTLAASLREAASSSLEHRFKHMAARRLYALLLGDVFLLVVFLDISLDSFLFLHNADEADNL
jgi:hypothetical protein